ncbi:disulfide bond formation protein DsbA [Geodermatophilus sp. Leaf369]|uniref:DsbA family oxidoreductase n=1 Tax=Geodermatophilus sp. Leaf369 TaxID=1736354 RepID=UPI0006F5028E|nr:DsbA family oxidoreductase [Geodermatophilus sp. Leaf369]KQS58658.1 disulfide bond formation protein DsbA [Geodermatophilus sp. Leaf369]
MKVEIWSDVVCPWCYIGKRRFETALSRFEHADDVEVVWRSFQLDPSVAEGDVHPTLPALAAKYGRSEDEMRAQMTSIDELAAAEGLDYDLANGVSGNTLLAHQLIHLAAERGMQDAMKERLLHAHFEERTSVFDLDALVALGVEVGLDADEARAALIDRRFLPAVHDDIATARALGATGVPFFVVDRTYGAAGAQPAEQLLAVLDRAWADTHPVLTTAVPAADGCTDDSCTV